MFSIGEYVVYGVEGVCRVEEAGKLKVAGLDKNRAYYRLRPYYHDGTIYTPVDGKAVMRPVLTREELERLLPRLPELEPLGDVPPDSRAAGEYYRAILSGHDCVALLRLCKTLHAKQNSPSASRRGVNSTELRSWRMAEERVCTGCRDRPIARRARSPAMARSRKTDSRCSGLWPGTILKGMSSISV